MPKTALMHKYTLRFLYIILGATVLLLLSIGIFAFLSLRNLVEEGDLVAHTNEVLFRSEEVVSTMKDAETGQRGFMITKDSVFLEPYHLAIAELGKQLMLVEALINLNPQDVQKARMVRLSRFARQRSAHLQHSLEIALEPFSPDRDMRLMATLRVGKVTMDSVRIIVNEIQATEKELLEERTKQKNRVTSNTMGWLLLISILAIGLFSAAFYFIIIEVVKRYRYERLLEKMVADLQRTNHDLEQFTFVASHHLQEPLRKMQTFSNRLEQKHAAELNPDARFLMARMNDSAQKMQVLLEDLLAYTGLSPEVGKAEMKPLNLADVIGQALKNQAAHIQTTKASLAWEKEPWKILGEESQLGLLFGHLLHNSLKFVSENALPEISIHTFATKGAEIEGVAEAQMNMDFVKIVFADQGIGIHWEYREKIFGLFQRLHHSNDYPGTGLGLAICARVVQNHNGIIRLAETPKGTTFHIFLPLAI